MTRLFGVFVWLAVSAGMVSESFADDVQDAVDLLTLTIKCPRASYEETYEPGEPVPNAVYFLLDQYSFAGDKELVRIKLKQTRLTGGTSRATSLGSSLSDWQTKFADLGAVLVSRRNGWDTVVLACKDGRNCFREEVTDERGEKEPAQQLDSVTIRACDEKNAARMKLAVQTLMKASRP